MLANQRRFFAPERHRWVESSPRVVYPCLVNVRFSYMLLLKKINPKNNERILKMSIIKFNKSQNIIEVNLSIDFNNRVKIEFISFDDIPDENILCGGFQELNEHNHIVQSDFSNMKYIYRQIEEDLCYIMTSDENDIYVEPPIIDQVPVELYVPTIEESRASKISVFSNICNMSIVNGVDIDIDGTIEHFSYAEEDQTNIKELFDLAVQANVPMYYHSDGKGCKLYTVEQIIELYTTATMNKMHHITYFNQLKMYISTLDDPDAINAIEYGYELTDEYLDTYNAAMTQAKIGMKTLLKMDNNA